MYTNMQTHTLTHILYIFIQSIIIFVFIIFTKVAIIWVYHELKTGNKTKTYACGNTHTHTHSLSHTHTHSLSLTHTHTLSLLSLIHI